LETGFREAVRVLRGARRDHGAGAELLATEEINTAISRVTENRRSPGSNARIEAARAGEHGPGFAAIADHLARMTESLPGAGPPAAGVLQGIRRGAGQSTPSAEQSLALLRGNFEKLQATARLFEQQAARVAEAAASADRISAAAAEQTRRIAEIASAMGSLDQAAAQFAPAAATLNSGTAQLAELQRELEAVLHPAR
jgi:methyl-accepting chemotaxis protein